MNNLTLSFLKTKFKVKDYLCFLMQSYLIIRLRNIFSIFFSFEFRLFLFRQHTFYKTFPRNC